MKTHMAVIIALLLIALGVQAQQPGMSQEQMMQMMQQAQQMQACFAKVDQQALMALGQKAQAMESEIKTLCQANKRSEAQSTAIKFGMEMSQDKNIKAARECGEMAQGMMPKMNYPTSEKDLDGRHICDGY
ncbi:MAG: hypothetical protein KDI20_10915 [Pseudomonadales bacterium]|nr:hypothetical protein [Pseudomonadales bacterium]